MLHFWIVTEVDEKPDFQRGRFQIVHKLGAMFGREMGDGFEFDEDIVAAEEIRDIGLLEGLSPIGEL